MSPGRFLSHQHRCPAYFIDLVLSLVIEVDSKRGPIRSTGQHALKSAEQIRRASMIADPETGMTGEFTFA
jgi:hypothetical protein